MKAQISKIRIVNRIRKEITRIDELAADISANGLLNPITVMTLDDENFQLLAGLRRLRAVEMLGYDEITVNIIAPVDAEAILRIEISENEQREPFTFTEKMDFARLLEEIEREKAKERKWAGIKIDDLTPHGAEGQKGETREIVAGKIGMSKTSYERAKYIADNASEEIIDELDQKKRSIRGTYEELKTKEKTEKVKERETPAEPSENKQNKNSIADMALGTINRTPVEDSKEHRDNLQKMRENVRQMAEYSRNHRRTIEEFQQVFRANAERFVDSLNGQFKFMDAETWASPTNKQIACDLIDEMVQAITNFKEEFLLWKS